MRRPRAVQLAVPTAAPAGAASAVSARRRDVRARAVRLAPWLVLALIVAAGLALRLWNNGYGLPYVYYYDEANHFTNYAVGMLSGNLDPSYYQNQSCITYMIWLSLHAVYGVFDAHLAQGSVTRQFAVDPTPIFQLARTVTALLSMAGIVATFMVARRFFGVRVALVAAAVLTFAFLPVNFSRIAVTDVGTFLPVAI